MAWPAFAVFQAMSIGASSDLQAYDDMHWYIATSTYNIGTRACNPDANSLSWLSQIESSSPLVAALHTGSYLKCGREVDRQQAYL